MNDPAIITIDHEEDFLGYCSALMRIQALAQEHVRRQVEAFGRPRDEMSEAQAEREHDE